MTPVPSTAEAITHRLAIIDLIVGYFAATDAKSWDVVEAFYTDDAVVRFNPESVTTGRSAIVGFTRSMLDHDEIVTYHHIGAFTPVVDGRHRGGARPRASHAPRCRFRAGRFWESLAIQHTHLARTPAGWRCTGYEWQVVVGLGSLDLFEGLRPT